jgi:hypothetical protein
VAVRRENKLLFNRELKMNRDSPRNSPGKANFHNERINHLKKATPQRTFGF